METLALCPGCDATYTHCGCEATKANVHANIAEHHDPEIGLVLTAPEAPVGVWVVTTGKFKQPRKQIVAALELAGHTVRKETTEGAKVMLVGESFATDAMTQLRRAAALGVPYLREKQLSAFLKGKLALSTLPSSTDLAKELGLEVPQLPAEWFAFASEFLPKRKDQAEVLTRLRFYLMGEKLQFNDAEVIDACDALSKALAAQFPHVPKPQIGAWMITANPAIQTSATANGYGGYWAAERLLSPLSAYLAEGESCYPALSQIAADDLLALSTQRIAREIETLSKSKGKPKELLPGMIALYLANAHKSPQSLHRAIQTWAGHPTSTYLAWPDENGVVTNHEMVQHFQRIVPTLLSTVRSVQSNLKWMVGEITYATPDLSA